MLAGEWMSWKLEGQAERWKGARGAVHQSDAGALQLLASHAVIHNHLTSPLPPSLPACRAGKSLASTGLLQMPGALLSSIDRDGRPLPAVTKEETLREGDILWFAGGHSKVQ